MTNADQWPTGRPSYKEEKWGALIWGEGEQDVIQQQNGMNGNLERGIECISWWGNLGVVIYGEGEKGGFGD